MRGNVIKSDSMSKASSASVELLLLAAGLFKPGLIAGLIRKKDVAEGEDDSIIYVFDVPQSPEPLPETATEEEVEQQAELVRAVEEATLFKSKFLSLIESAAMAFGICETVASVSPRGGDAISSLRSSVVFVNGNEINKDLMDALVGNRRLGLRYAKTASAITEGTDKAIKSHKALINSIFGNISKKDKQGKYVYNEIKADLPSFFGKIPDQKIELLRTAMEYFATGDA